MELIQIRQSFLDFFHKKGHVVVNSGPLILKQPSILLFANAGMVQFKDIFTGRHEKFASRVTSSQYCLRVGGKHNDLENVGFTTRHHTFFEMLGNFSFGDYFKKDAIVFAWEYIINVLNLSKERLYVTVYKGDTVSADLWRYYTDIKFSNLILKGCKDNFWTMGDTGPCGYCSELFYDRGSTYRHGERYIELWNLVFIEYVKLGNNVIQKLDTHFVDTGMGLERVTSVVQGVYNNYLIDVFDLLIRSFITYLGTTKRRSSLYVIADHIRACLFLISAGLKPTNTGAGYVLRRIIRRSIYHVMCFGDFYFYNLVPEAVSILSTVYPHVVFNKEIIINVLKSEEDRFRKTLITGIAVLNKYIDKLYTDTLSGQILFKLHDTYGFPISFINDIIRDKSIKVDVCGFRHAFLKHKEISRSFL